MKAIKANNFVAINKDEVQFDLLLINNLDWSRDVILQQ